MQKLKEERRELSEIKQYSTGWAFSRFVDKIFLGIINKMKSDHHDFALGMQQAYKKQYENDFLEIVFLKENRGHPIWHNKFWRKTYDCKNCDLVHDSGIKLTCAEFGQYLSEQQGHEVSLCREHMSDSELDDHTADSMDKKFNEMVDRMISDNAKIEVRREWKLAFDQSDGYRYT